MLSTAEKTVNTAIKNGAAEAEAYIYEGEANNIGIELGQVNKSNQIIDRGIGVRVSINKAVGFAYTNIINDPVAIEKIVAIALSAAKASKPDPDWKGLPQKKPYAQNLVNTFDSKVLEIHPDELVNMASTMLDSAIQVDKRIFPAEGGIGNAYIANAIVNSNGTSGFDKGTVI